MGCGESKHAIATTESVSSRRRLSSKSSKKGENLEVKNEIKAATNNDSNTPATIPLNPLPVQQKPKSEENVAVDAIKDLPLGTKEQKEENKETKVAQAQEKGKELEAGHDRKSSQDSQYEYLSVNEAKSEDQSTHDVATEESILKEIEKPINEDIKEYVSDVKDNNEIIKSGKLENMNEVIKEATYERALTELDVTPKAAMEDIISTVDP